MKETKFKQTLVQTKEGSRHCEEHSDVAIQSGFKMTEVGMIPSDWEVFELSQLYDITSSKRVFQKDWTSAGVPFYRAREIAVMSAGKTPEDDLFITREMFDAYTTQYGKIRENDVLITGVGTLGKVYVVKAKDEFYFKDGNIIWLQWKRKNSSLLLKLFFETNIVIDQIFGNSGGSTVATYTISNAKKTKIPLPPTIKEQQRIANALSDVDTLIANLEKLIAKKKNIKQGAMQQLLTGKKRLPGFGLDERTGSRPTDERRKECHSERSAKREVEESNGYKMTELGLIPNDWEVKKLKEIGVFSKGAGISRDESNSGNIPAVRYGEIYTKHNDYIKEFYSHISQDVAEKSVKMQRGDLLFSASGETKEDIGKTIAFVDDFDAYAGGDIIIFTPTETIDSIYMGYLLNFPSIAKQKAMKAQGDAVVHITTDSLKKLIICLPSYQEQTAIANVLSDMDTEISALETKLAKYRTLKTGMMQQLLTGKIRLV